MFIELERLKDPESCRNYLKNELQKARQPKRVHYFITAADWMFYENEARSGGAGNPIAPASMAGRIHDTTETGGKLPEDAIELCFPTGCRKWLRSMSYYKLEDANRLFDIAYCVKEDMNGKGYGKVIDAVCNEMDAQHKQGKSVFDAEQIFNFTRTGQNDREQKFTYVWPRLWLNDDSTAASKIGTILGKCQTAFQKGYFEELFNHPELFIRKDCPRRPSNLHQRYCKRAFPWEFERSKKRIGCPWLQLPDDGRPFQEAWKEAGRRWFRYKFIEKAKNGRN